MSHASKKSATFSWKAANGTTIVLPSMNALKGKAIRKHRRREAMDFLFSLIEDHVDEETLAQIDELDRAELTDMFAAWQDEEGVTPGES